MKIIKVIVDELPRACINCGWADHNSCTLRQCREFIMEDLYKSRPNWCPLILRHQVIGWLDNTNKTH